MSHPAAEQPQAHMGLPLANGKLAMWMFLVTEIMFFTALIGTYLLLRTSTVGVGVPFLKVPVHASPGELPPMGDPARYERVTAQWPTPSDVHLEEYIGAGNTFVLILSSLTVVLAHWALTRKNVRLAVIFVGVTLALGALFLVVKA